MTDRVVAASRLRGSHESQQRPRFVGCTEEMLALREDSWTFRDAAVSEMCRGAWVRTFDRPIEGSLWREKGLAMELRPEPLTFNLPGIGPVGSAYRQFESAEELFKKADEIADRVKIDATVLDLLYRHSRHRPMPRQAWEQGVRTACSVELLTHQRRTFPGLIEENVRTEFLDKLRSMKGVLLLNFHGGFVAISRRLLTSMDEHLVFTAPEDPAASLFLALRALQDGRPVQIAVDGRGKRSARLDIFGTTVMVPEGAAFLAYTAGCQTVWYYVVREGSRLVPEMRLGPWRQANESQQAFSLRLYKFCAERIEAVLTGDPYNLALPYRMASQRAAASRIFRLCLADFARPERLARRTVSTSPD